MGNSNGSGTSPKDFFEKISKTKATSPILSFLLFWQEIRLMVISQTAFKWESDNQFNLTEVALGAILLLRKKNSGWVGSPNAYNCSITLHK